MTCFTLTSPTEIRLQCPAKVNLALSVGAAQPDGYHPIASWMVATTFADALAVRRLTGSHASRFDIRFADDAPQPQPVDWPLDRDLGYRAHRLLEAHAAAALPVHVSLSKRMPAGAGLGGGSSNAAAVLVGVRRLFDLPIEDDQLAAMGARLGCDVAFLVRAMLGSPSAIATGLGEQLRDAPLSQPIHLVIILPPLRCPTGPVYQAFDRLGARPARPDEARVAALPAQRPLDPRRLFNDLAEPAFSVVPDLRRTAREAADSLSRPVHVTGSGAALFALATDAEDASRCATTLADTHGLPAVAAHTL